MAPNKRLIIGHCLEYLGYNTGGAETHVRDLCRQLDKELYQNELVTSISPFSKPRLPITDLPIHYSLGLYEMREWVCRSREPFASIFFYFPKWLFRRTVQKHLRRSYDIWHMHSPNALQAALEAGVRAPKLITLYVPPTTRQKWYIQRADAIIVRSILVGEQLSQLTGQESIYIPPGCNFQRFKQRSLIESRHRLGIDQNALILLCVARLTPAKNIISLIRALAVMRQSETRLRLIIVGEGPLGASLKQEAFEVGVGEYVDFLGNRQPDDVAIYYNAADLFILPSVFESFSQVSLEALASGTRVLISTAMTEFQRVFPMVPSFSPHDVNELAYKALKLLKEDHISIPDQYFARFTWPQLIHQHEMIYQQLAHNQQKVNIANDLTL